MFPGSKVLKLISLLKSENMEDFGGLYSSLKPLSLSEIHI